ncbi:hypothetical protein P7C70_g9580, partial [Phenoliferia sp. Uapishka_3]
MVSPNPMDAVLEGVDFDHGFTSEEDLAISPRSIVRPPDSLPPLEPKPRRIVVRTALPRKSGPLAPPALNPPQGTSDIFSPTPSSVEPLIHTLPHPPPPLLTGSLVRSGTHASHLPQNTIPPPQTTQTSTGTSRLSERARQRRIVSADRDRQLKATLPEFRYDKRGTNPPRLVYTVEESEIRTALDAMEGPLGFDIEWDPYPPSTPGQATGPGKTALAQVCDTRTVLLIHLARMPALSPSLRALIEDPLRIKLGVQVAG